MNNQIRIRIINKTKNDVTLNMKEQGIKRIPWSTFNEMFVIVDNVWAVFNEETQKKQEKFDELINTLCANVLIQRNMSAMPCDKPSLTAMALIGGTSIKIQKEFGLNPIQIKQIVEKRIALLKNPNTWKETPQEYKERKAKEAKEEDNYRRGNISNAKESLANVKGADKLRELFKKQDS